MGSAAEAQARLLDDFGGPLGFGQQCLGANDDASSEGIDLSATFPGGLRWGTRRFFTLYINNNGNVSLGEALSDFTPTPFEHLETPVIAPYWLDLDSRPAGCGAEIDPGNAAPCDAETASKNVVWWQLEPGRMAITWLGMGRYQCDPSVRVSVQLIIESAGCLAAGDFDITFRHALCEFTSGDASKSEGQTVHAQVGFGGGDSRFEELSASRTSEIGRMACETGAEPGVHRFSIRSGVAEPQVCLGAGGSCDTGKAGVCANGALSCEPDGTICAQLVESSEEICDGHDNDCDGEFDETSSCAQGECVAGNCAPYCDEDLCPGGLVCDGRFCVPRSCRNVTCEEGSFCRDGDCVGSCEDVFCPPPETCVAGRCQDLCAHIKCDENCEVCRQGSCVARCIPGDCEDGYSCIDGRCESTTCLNIDCAGGLVCRAGVCEAACERVRCPRGFTCENGRCETERTVHMKRVDPGTRRATSSPTCSLRARAQGVDALFLLMIALAISRAWGLRARGKNRFNTCFAGGKRFDASHV